MGWPVAGSHSRTVPSFSALARILPSGLNATALKPYRPAWRPAPIGSAGGRVPQPDRALRLPPPGPLAARVLPSGLNASPDKPLGLRRVCR